MERIIQPYGAPAAGPPGRPAPGGPSGALPAAGHPAKTTSDFARALRRRVWLVLAVALVVSLAGSALVLRMPAVYQASASFKVNPPQFDPVVTAIIKSAAPISQSNNELYITDLVAQLKTRALADDVIRDLDAAAGSDPYPEIVAGLKTQNESKTNRYHVTLEGRDPARAAALLNALLRALLERARSESLNDFEATDRLAKESVQKMEAELKKINEEIKVLLADAPELTLDGKNRLAEDTEMLKSILARKVERFDTLQFERRLAEQWPNLGREAAPSPDATRIERLLAMRQDMVARLQDAERPARNPRSDPYAQAYRREIQKIDGQLAEFRQPLAQARPDFGALHLTKAADEIRGLRDGLAEREELLRASNVRHQQYLALLKKQDQQERLISDTRYQLANHELLARSKKDPVQIEQLASEPPAPVKPNRPMLIVAACILGVILGVALVCLLESLDHSVKVPEQLTMGLTLPLFGVVPRMRRLARMERGGHLWTPAMPGSIESDAFRNLRASLLGAERPDQPIVTLLVTSAKQGEGKSTTALNLAATCARAGERTILVDCDLRRPSLGEVFDAADGVGLADVLQGLMPWQRAVVRSEIPNLNFLPAGDPTGVPIEVLGSLELRQLIAALAGHYHRVILDGPAVLGLADCRMLGQVVDATLLVVRSGAHELRPLRRAKEMLEQSRVRIAGVVFNGLNEDLDNWASESPALEAGDPDGSRGGPAGRGLGAPAAGASVGAASS